MIFISIYVKFFLKFDVIHDFSVLLRTGSNLADINRFPSLLEIKCLYPYFLSVTLLHITNPFTLIIFVYQQRYQEIYVPRSKNQWVKRQGGRGQWAVYYTSPQSCIIRFLIRWLNNFGDYFDWLVHFRTFQPLTVICRRGNFVYNHRGCTSIYRPLSYPFRSLI